MFRLAEKKLQLNTNKHYFMIIVILKCIARIIFKNIRIVKKDLELVFDTHQSILSLSVKLFIKSCDISDLTLYQSEIVMKDTRSAYTSYI